MEVGVRQLKQHLSEYVKKAARGVLIQVTERGVPKAILGPLPGRFRLDQGSAEGWVRRGDGGSLAPLRRARSPRRSTDVLAEDRDS